jgi:hypothetical protein
MHAQVLTAEREAQEKRIADLEAIARAAHRFRTAKTTELSIAYGESLDIKLSKLPPEILCPLRPTSKTGPAADQPGGFTPESLITPSSRPSRLEAGSGPLPPMRDDAKSAEREH